ncbi:L-ascorbate oxidase-like [Gossypium australe]|uniref:L-ascorbate oxidase-like n=1 Tax=Gossypium australe TaxID=47621 RepID=A0A5B6VIC0_9ROSI|nr:L-ascorbate oxidase-like [Gossypium australe]
MHGAPDCLEHVVMGINGQFPGPTIRAKAGDTIVVDLVNKLHNEGVVIHWHGIGQAFLLLSSLHVISEGLSGSLIVDIADGKKEPFRYHDELNLLLSDWWHKSSHEQEVGISSNPYRWISSSISQCKFKNEYNAHPQSWNKTYRLRIASITALASLNLAIEDGNVTVVEGDGNYVQPNQTLSKYWISIGVRRREPKTRQALAILSYSESKTSLHVSHLKHLNGTIMIVARHSLKAYLPSRTKIISQYPRPITVGLSFLTPKTKSVDINHQVVYQ